MDQLVVRVFDAFDQAEHARDLLFSQGFATEAIELSVREDEAGPTEGNFTVGNSSVGSIQHTYDTNYAHILFRGQCMVTVLARGTAQAAHACLILERFGGRDPDSRTPFGA